MICIARLHLLIHISIEPLKNVTVREKLIESTTTTIQNGRERKKNHQPKSKKENEEEVNFN